MPNTVRQRIDRASLPVMTKLSQLPRAVPFLVLLVLLLAGAVISGVAGFALMGLASAFIGWILYLAWPQLTGSERIMRLAVLLLAIATAVTRLQLPRG